MLFSIPVSSIQQGPFRPNPWARCRRGPRYEELNSPSWLCPPPAPHHLLRFGPFSPCKPLDGVVKRWKTVAGVNHNEMPIWNEQVTCEGFTDKEITVKITENQVCVEGFHESNSGTGNSEIRQMKKTVKIPDDVNGETVKAFFSQEGTVIIKGTRNPDRQNVQKSDEKTGKHDCEESPHEGETTPDRWPTDRTNSTPAEPMEDVSEANDINQQETPELTYESQDVQGKEETADFKINVDMSRLNPDSIEVLLSGNNLTITANEEKLEEGKVIFSRTLSRKYTLPEDVNCDLLSTTLNKDGQLVITAPYNTHSISQPRDIPISIK